ncbi:MAG: YybH family protein [Gemmatimonadales bacterium]
MSGSARFAAALLLLGAAACQPAAKDDAATMGAMAAPAALSAEDEAAVRALDAEWARVAVAGDGNALAALYTADAVVMPPNEPTRRGDAAKQYWIDFANTFTAQAELATEVVEGRGDLAFTSGTWRMTLTPKTAGAKPMPAQEGKYLGVMKKQPDGSWKLAYDIWNVGAPAAPAAEAATK